MRMRLLGIVGAALLSTGLSACTIQITLNDLVGHWSGDWGEMYLKQVNGRVRGVYTHADGRVIGDYANDQFTGTWSQTPTRLAPTDAGDVEFDFTDTNGELKLDGRWRYGSTGTWAEDWDLTWTESTIPPDIDLLFLNDSEFVEL